LSLTREWPGTGRDWWGRVCLTELARLLAGKTKRKTALQAAKRTRAAAAAGETVDADMQPAS